MKLLLLSCLPLCAFAFSINAETSIQPKSKHGTLSAENRAKLHQEWGFDPEERRARLERISNKFALKLKANQGKKTLNEAEVIPMDIKREDNIVDIVKGNQRVGVAPYLFEGDIHLTEDQLARLERMSEETRAKRQIDFNNAKWTDNTVYFYFDDSITKEKKNLVYEAHETIQKLTCVNFVESNTAVNRIKVFNGTGCYSRVGMIGGEQRLSFGDTCIAMEGIAHEFIHTLGVHHMQSRSDRDNFVTVDLEFVDDENKGNFAKYDPDYIYTPYDYGSVMHYNADSLVNKTGAVSVIPKDDRFLFGIGDVQFSFYDFEMINRRYECHAACNAQNSAKCRNGGVPNPRNCSICNCPRGYGGELCDQRAYDCGREIEASEEWQMEQVFLGDRSTKLAPQGRITFCNHWITAPAGKQIEVKVLYMDTLVCQYGCVYNGFEVKTDADPRNPNPVYCCKKSFADKVFQSSLNPLPVISYTRTDYISLFFEYRYVDAVQPSLPTTTSKSKPQTTTTTSAPTPSPNCKDMNSSCDLIWGICDGAQPFNVTKYNCGKTCGLCGKAASPCVDSPQCAGVLAKGGCAPLDPMYAEYYCAKTCGYCDHPN